MKTKALKQCCKPLCFLAMTSEPKKNNSVKERETRKLSEVENGKRLEMWNEQAKESHHEKKDRDELRSHKLSWW